MHLIIHKTMLEQIRADLIQRGKLMVNRTIRSAFLLYVISDYDNLLSMEPRKGQMNIFMSCTRIINSFQRLNNSWPRDNKSWLRV